MADTSAIEEVLVSGEERREYEPSEASIVLEQYKLYVEMADRVSARRLTANSFFLSINTALLALIGYARSAQDIGEAVKLYWLVAAAGIVLCYLWYRLIRSYRDLNSAKFKVIHAIEARLPLRPYDAEWEAVGRGKDKSLYWPVTHVELGIPWVFMLIHAVVISLSLPWMLSH